MKTNLDTKYYYIINDDLKMSKGKIVAQVSHVAMMLGEKHKEIGRAIILKAPKDILEMIMVNAPNISVIFDAGFTEVPAGSLTCIGFKSGTEKMIDEKVLIKDLKLV